MNEYIQLENQNNGLDTSQAYMPLANNKKMAEETAKY